MDNTSNTPKGLIYGLNDRPKFGDALFAAFQHLLSVFVPVITPALIIGKALNMDVYRMSFMISMALFTSGMATFIQCHKLGRVGCGLLCVQGTSFSFIGPIIAIGSVGGLPLIYGACMMGSTVEMLVSVTFKYLRNVITPLVSGVVVMLIGLSLIKVGIISCGGGNDAIAHHTFGAPQNLLVAAVVLVSVILFNTIRNKYVRMGSIFIGIIIGYIVSFALGMVDIAQFKALNFSGISLPMPFKYGVSFNISSVIGVGLIYLVTAVEATGDITANSMISGEPIEGEKYIKRVSGGVLADGINSCLSSMLTSFPCSIFAQNNGIIQLTGVASRYVGYFIAALLVLLGLFPAVGMIFSMMPAPVLGGATLLMFGTVAAAGVRIVLATGVDRKASLVIAVSLSLGMGVELMPSILDFMSPDVRSIFSSGITTGGLTAILSNLLIRIKD